MHWSTTTTANRKIQAAVASIPDDAWIDIDYTVNGYAQVAETIGGGRRKADRRSAPSRRCLASGAVVDDPRRVSKCASTAS